MGIDKLENIKTVLNILSTDNDPLITVLIEPITVMLESRCNRHFVEKTYTEEPFNGDGSQRLWVGCKGNISAVSALSIDGVEIDTSLLHIHDYYIDIDRDSNTTFCKGQKNVLLTFTAGYSETTMPEDLKLAFAQMIAFQINQSRAAGLDNKNVRGRSVKYSDKLPLLVKFAIAKYRYIHVGVL